MLILPPGNRLATISYFSINLFLEKSPLKEPEKISLKTHCFDFFPRHSHFVFWHVHIFWRQKGWSGIQCFEFTVLAILDTAVATKFHSGFCFFVNIECNQETIFRIKLSNNAHVHPRRLKWIICLGTFGHKAFSDESTDQSSSADLEQIQIIPHYSSTNQIYVLNDDMNATLTYG